MVGECVKRVFVMTSYRIDGISVDDLKVMTSSMRMPQPMVREIRVNIVRDNVRYSSIVKYKVKYNFHLE